MFIIQIAIAALALVSSDAQRLGRGRFAGRVGDRLGNSTGFGGFKGRFNRTDIGGRRGRRGGGIEGDLREIFGDESPFVNTTCPESSTTAEPDCFARRGEVGSWVCRTLYNPFTGEAKEFNDCITETRGLETDTCGCCGGVCPPTCPCECEMRNGETGVLVTGSEGERSICVPAERAVSMIVADRFSCVEECPVEEVAEP